MSRKILSPAQHLCRVLAQLGKLPGGQVRSKGIDWMAWHSLAQRHRVDAFIGAHIESEILAPHLPDPIKKELRIAYVSQAPMASRRLQALNTLRSLLEGENIAFTLLKGSAVWPVLYEHAAERIQWDIDLLIDPTQDPEPVNALLQAHGYRTLHSLPGYHHHLDPVSDPANPVPVEIHVNLMTPPLPGPVMQAFWKHRVNQTVPGCGRVPVLNEVARLAHHALHALSDPMDGPLLRNLFETGCLASRLPDEKTVEFKSFVEFCGITDPVTRALHLASEWFGSPPLLPLRRATAWEFWANQRLKEVHPDHPSARVLRQLGRKHIESMQAGGRRSLLVALPALACAEGRAALGQRLKKKTVRPTTLLKQVEAKHLEIGQGLLLHHPETGEVHLLNPQAKAIWKKCGPATACETLLNQDALKASDRKERLEMIRQLVALDLLRRV